MTVGRRIYSRFISSCLTQEFVLPYFIITGTGFVFTGLGLTALSNSMQKSVLHLQKEKLVGAG